MSCIRVSGISRRIQNVSCTVKTAMHKTVKMKTCEDLYLSRGGGLEASLFPHARMSDLEAVMMQDRTAQQDQRKATNYRRIRHQASDLIYYKADVSEDIFDEMNERESESRE